MKRGMYLIVFVMLLCVCVTASASASADPLLSATFATPVSGEDTGYEDALAIAREAWLSQIENQAEAWEPGITSEFLTIDISGTPERAWRIVFHTAQRIDEPNFVVVVLSPSNKVAFAEEFIESEKILEWENEKGGSFDYWSLQDKALFYALYMDDPIDEVKMGVPGEGDVTVEEALLRAAEILVESGVAREDIESKSVSVNFWVNTTDGLDECPWIIVYYDPTGNNEDSETAVYQVNLYRDGTEYYVYNYYVDGPSIG